MGPYNSKPKETDEQIAHKTVRSKHLSDSRRKRKQVYTSMIKRVLSNPKSNSLILLPDNAFFKILQYLAPEMKNLLGVSACLHVKIIEVIDHGFSVVESQFALVHSHLLVFKKSYQDSINIAVAERKGIRVDRIIVSELLPILVNHTIKLRYTYRLYNNEYVYKCEFKFDCISKGKKKV